jgi:hypothetical protein
MVDNIYNGHTLTSQTLYDSYNNLIFASDKRVFHKMTKKIELYLKVKDLFGDILEFGVFKGSGMGLFLKLTDMYETNSLTNVIGFDYFNKSSTLDALDGINKSTMTSILDRAEINELSIESVNNRLSVIENKRYLLIEGDAVAECKKFDMQTPGQRIKLIYMDLDVGEPTYKILQQLWKKLVKGGIVVFDEYGYNRWDESSGVDMFLKEIEGQYNFVNTKIIAPTAYIVKLVQSI